MVSEKLHAKLSLRRQLTIGALVFAVSAGALNGCGGTPSSRLVAHGRPRGTTSTTGMTAPPATAGTTTTSAAAAPVTQPAMPVAGSSSHRGGWHGTPGTAPAPPPPVPVSPPLLLTPKGFGIAEPPWYLYENGGNAGLLQRVALMKQLGATWLRVDFPERGIGTQEYNDIYREVSGAGIKMIALANAPYPSNSAEYVRNLLSHYPNIRAIEMGNEPNLGLGGTALGFPEHPEVYAATLGPAYDAKQAINPSVYLITGGMSPWGPGDPAATHGDYKNPYWYLKAMLESPAVQAYRAMHGHSPWDAIGHHTYDYWADQVHNGVPVSNAYNLLACHLLAVAHGDPGQMWQTEQGYSTGQTTVSRDPVVAAQWLRDLGRWSAQQPWIGPLEYFNLDTPSRLIALEGGFGLVAPNNGNPAFSPHRATWDAFSSLAHG